MSALRFLDDDWLAKADEALSTLDPLPVGLVVGYHIVDGPQGTSAHRLILGPERVGAARGIEGAAVVLHMDWSVAAGIAKGETSGQRAFLDGRISLDGDPTILLGHQHRLSEIDDRLDRLRTDTTFD